jgi:release factor glutamine methyltransferase
MTIKEIQKKNKDVEVDLLLAHVLKQPKEFLYLNPQVSLTPQQTARLTTLVGRRQNGEPIAYLVGYKYFYGLRFKINKHVLTPRPETEWLVEQALNKIKNKELRIKNNKPHFTILDVGTGSGCIAVSIAKRVTLLLQKGNPFCTVTASDISASALKVAAQNAKTHKANVRFIKSDLFKNIHGKFDIITANLPYVPQGMYELLFHNLKYEPKVAITDGGEVWDMYRRFFIQLPKHIKPGGAALLEIDDGSKPDLQKMLKQLLPDYKALFYKDFNGLWRYLEIQA